MKLFEMSPIGLGTEFVESFPSYMLRLAAGHGVSLRMLVDAIKTDDGKSAISCDGPLRHTRTAARTRRRQRVARLATFRRVVVDNAAESLRKSSSVAVKGIVGREVLAEKVPRNLKR